MLRLPALLLMVWLVARTRDTKIIVNPAVRRNEQKADEKPKGPWGDLARRAASLIGTALVTGITVPIILGEWEKGSKEVEIKYELVVAMSDASGEYIAYQSTRVLGTMTEEPEDITRRDNEEFQKFWRARQVIQAKLAAYIPKRSGVDPTDQIPFKWDQYGQRLEQFFDLYKSPDQAHRQRVAADLESYFRQFVPSYRDAPTPQWQVLHTPSHDGFRLAWFRLRRLFLLRNAELAEMVLASCTRLRGIPFPWEDCVYRLPPAPSPSPSPSPSPEVVGRQP